MIRTIKQRLYWVGLVPLAMLAVALVIFNGLARINEASRELENARSMTAALLQGPAVDALVVGNIVNFERIATNVVKTSPWLVCVSLRDARRRAVSQAGNCDGAIADLNYQPITAPTSGFADFKTSPNQEALQGEIGLLTDDRSVVRKRRQVILQLALSLALVGCVLAFTGRLLRARLIEPIQRIDIAMQALSQRDYTVRVPIAGHDELTRLAEAINATIDTIAAYTHELERYARESERRRSEADRALHDAVAAHLARDGLVRSLTEDLNDPLTRMHADLTAVAIANTDPQLKGRIRAIIALLQEAQGDLVDLLEIATGEQGLKPPLAVDLEDTLSDIERDIRLLSAEGAPVDFLIRRSPPADSSADRSRRIVLNVDGVRLRKALVYLIRAMARRCAPPGVYVNAELIRRTDDQLHVSIHLNAFYEPIPGSDAALWVEGLNPQGNIAALVGWTDRESRIVDCLLKSVDMTPAVSASPAGVVSVLLGATYNCFVASSAGAVPLEWSVPAPISATVVSDDVSLMRLTTRSDIDIVNHEIRLVSMAQALAAPTALLDQDALLVDISDLADGTTLIGRLKGEGTSRPTLIALCPPGRISESLSERLLELGFIGIIQKPLHYSRVLEVIRTAMSHTFGSVNRNVPGQSREP